MTPVTRLLITADILIVMSLFLSIVGHMAVQKVKGKV